jgi:hypothetical protein
VQLTESCTRNAPECQICAPQLANIDGAVTDHIGGSGSPRLLRSLIPGTSIQFVRVRSYDRPDRSIVTVLLDTSM